MKKRIIIIAVVLVVSLQLFILGYRNYKTRMDLHTNSSYSVEMVNPGVFSRTEDEKTEAYTKLLEREFEKDINYLNGVVFSKVNLVLDDNNDIQGVRVAYTYDEERISEERVTKLKEDIEDFMQANCPDANLTVSGYPMMENVSEEYVDGKQGPEITLPYNLDEEWNIVPLD